jgi:hypothetical protein
VTDHAELIERLRAYRAYCPNTDRADHPICNEAATALAALVAERDALAAEVAKLREVLKPFATIDGNFTTGDMKRARTALAGDAG